MERFNPFANSSVADELDSPINSPANFASSASPARQATTRTAEQLAGSGGSGAARFASTGASAAATSSSSSSSPTSIIARGQQQPASASGASRYSTSFPDPFGDSTTIRGQHSAGVTAAGAVSARAGSRSNSVTFATPTSCSVDELQQSPTRLAGAPRAARGPAGATSSAGGFTSFLSRATSVTSSSVTDRVSGAVGSVRSAVDLLSNQIQQAVPTSLINERLLSNNNSAQAEAGGSSQAISFGGSQQATSADQQQQSAASYLASKISSATNQFVGSSSGQSSSSLPMISRQRIVLILESPSQTNWTQQFKNYRRLTSGQSAASTAQSALTSFFSSATAQLTSSTFASSSSLASPSCAGDVIDGDLVIDQADFRDVSVLANQSSSTVTIRIANQASSHQQYGLASSSAASSSSSMSQRPSLSQLKDDPYSSRRSNSAVRIVRPEYVIVKQRTRERLEHLRKIVTALNYCLVPMFEPFDVWTTFQDRQLIFARLLRVQKTLGKESFPLIPQLYCQTHLDLLNYLNNTTSTTSLPCLVRTSGPLGKGKIKIDNLQMLKDFASIVATSGLSCTIEQYLDVKCDLIVQKLGTSLKLFRRINSNNNSSSASGAGANELSSSSLGIGREDLSSEFGDSRDLTARTNDHSTFTRQQATRQTSIGSSVLSSFIAGATQQSSSLRRSSNPVGTNYYERLSEVNFRYKSWVDAIGREFNNQLQAFCIKIVVASNDREYVVGLNDCSMEFLGNSDNQEEDKRSFVELIISNMNTLLPKTNLSRESSNSMTPSSAAQNSQATTVPRRSSSDDQTDQQREYDKSTIDQDRMLGDKRKFTSQSQINGSYQTTLMNSNSISHGGGGSVGRGQVGSGAPAPRSYGQLSNRSQSVSINQSDYLMTDQTLNKSAYYGRRGSDRSDSDAHQQQQQTTFGSFSSANPFDYTNSNQQSISSSSNASSLHHQRQSSLGQSLLDQTSTAFSSLHKQSMSFFKRLDSRGGDIVGSTPPQSAKSDIGFDRSFITSPNTAGISSATRNLASSDAGRNGFKSQSVDSSLLGDSSRPGSRPTGGRRRETPPKPPPPHQIGNRQSSLASYSTQRPISSMNTPSSTRQNSENISDYSRGGSTSMVGSTQRGRVVRQNSALSAFEPFDLDIAVQLRSTEISEPQAKHQQPSSLDMNHPSATITGAASMGSVTGHQAVDKPHKSLPDSASVTSGDSNSTGDTTSAEDTMNNLKKTFASIFGDKCE